MKNQRLLQKEQLKINTSYFLCGPNCEGADGVYDFTSIGAIFSYLFEYKSPVSPYFLSTPLHHTQLLSFSYFLLCV
jgi:hypothetical protein